MRMPELESNSDSDAEKLAEAPADRKIIVLENSCHSEFFGYMKKNRPCILKGAAAGWRATQRWRRPDGGPDLEELVREYGECSVPVVEGCRRTTMLFREYAEYWKSAPSPAGSVAYLKDWHLRRQRPDDDFYAVPEHFSSDWLNEYSLDRNADDFMFVYMGPKGSWTPFHVDVYSSFSWSANIVGRKRWLLFPPGEESRFARPSGEWPLDVEELLGDDSRHFEATQHPGDAIFVPSGWYHQVCNLDDAISINHNWFNGCNVGRVWNALKENHSLVEKEIFEFRDDPGWAEQCQLVLRASFGMNCREFADLIEHVAHKRMDRLKDNATACLDRQPFDERQIDYDLRSISPLLREMVSEERLFDPVRVESLQKTAAEVEAAIPVGVQ